MTIKECAEAMATYIEEHGWAQGIRYTSQGEVCLAGALDKIVPMHDTIAPACMKCKMFDAIESRIPNKSIQSWNDLPGRTKEEVVTFLRSLE